MKLLLIKCLQCLCDVNCTVMITSELNLPDINGKDPNLLSDHDDCSSMFLLFTKQFGFEQLVHELTRPSNSTPGSGSIIDLVLCTDSHVIHSLTVTCRSVLAIIDNCSVTFEASYLPLKGAYSFPVDVNNHNFYKSN